MLSSELFIVSETEKEMRLDKLLSKRFPTYSRTYFQYLIDNGSVLVNGLLLKKREEPKLGDQIRVFFTLPPPLSLEPEEIPLDILYEDEEILAINKSAGMVVHPAAGHPNQTFVNALLYHCKQGAIPTSSWEEAGLSLRPGVVHRLDKETSGLLLAAKTPSMHALLTNLFANREIEKHYLAICIGHPGNITVETLIGRDPIHRKMMRILESGGKRALSYFQTLKTKDHLSLVDIHPVTGRTHQIRVQMKHLNSPILGDKTYGSTAANLKYGVDRQLLHAHTLSFKHPRTQQMLTLTASPPKDFLKWMNIFKM